MKFACVDGPEFDGTSVDFDLAMKRQQMYKTEEGRAILNSGRRYPSRRMRTSAEVTKIMANVLKKVPVREQDPKVRATNFKEVCLGYNMEEAVAESESCLDCKNAKCIAGCPVSINIPGFIQRSKRKGNFEEAYKVIALSLPHFRQSAVAYVHRKHSVKEMYPWH